MNPHISPLQLTRDLLAIDTINPPGREVECARRVGRLLEDGGFKVAAYEFAPGRTSLVATLEGTGDKLPICFTGHIDTVPLGSVRWAHDPFSGEVEGDKVYGRGSTDMKSGIAAMIIAALRRAASSRGRAGMTLVITAGEEVGCEGAHYLATRSGALGRAGAIVVGEPTSNYPLVGHKGCLWLKIRTHGVTAHGSMPDLGENAIYKAARIATLLENFNFKVRPHPLLGLPTLNLGTISGGLNINSVPDEATMGLDIRTVPGIDNEAICRELSDLIGPGTDIEPMLDCASVATHADDPWVEEVFEVTALTLGERPVPRAATFVTDASVLTSAYGNPPTVILGPGEPAMAHKTDEFCHIFRIEQATEMYTEIARRWCEV